MVQKVIITKGIPASGKSTWAKQYVLDSQGSCKRINNDDLRAMIDAGSWSKTKEKNIVTIRNTLLRQFLSDGFSVIIDATNLRLKHEKVIRDICENEFHNVRVEVKWFPITLEDAIKRNKVRKVTGGYVGPTVIRRMYTQYEEAGGPTPQPLPTKQLPPSPKYNHKLRDAIVCDLDGTLSLFEEKGHRGPYEQEKCNEDECNEAIARILSLAWNDGIVIVLLSGRNSLYRPQTQEFLNKHNINYHALIMRKEGDTRKDAIVKQELYERSLKGYFNILFVLDDRTQVVNMWRQNGLQCFQVAPGDF